MFDLHIIIEKYFTPDFAERVLCVTELHPCMRQTEMEADHIGLLLMASSGYDPQVAPKFYEKLDKVDDSRDSMLREYLFVHPSFRKRAKALARPKMMNEALIIYKESMVERLIIYSFHP